MSLIIGKYEINKIMQEKERKMIILSDRRNHLELIEKFNKQIPVEKRGVHIVSNVESEYKNKFKNYNISGFVIGFLDNKKKLSNTLLSEFRSATNGYELTFHRAFDYLLEQETSLEKLITLNFLL